MNLLSLVQQFPGCPILVVGDLMLDEFVWGQVSRISPEAPVPVVEVKQRTYTLGGAANTAANISSLGGQAALAGWLGDDEQARQFRSLLAGLNITSQAILTVPGRPTTTKTRIFAGTQQVVRIDQERIAPVTERPAQSLLEQLEAVLPSVRVCLISDYGKGVISPDFVQHLILRANRLNIPTIVDPKGVDYQKYRGATLVKPNQLEAGKVLNRDLHSSEDVDWAGDELLKFFGGQTSILITRGPQGMTLFDKSGEVVHVPTQAREVFDVTGAGDTVAGTMALTLGVGGSLPEACHLASLAAAVVVGKRGTATCSRSELEAAVRSATFSA